MLGQCTTWILSQQIAMVARKGTRSAAVGIQNMQIQQVVKMQTISCPLQSYGCKLPYVLCKAMKKRPGVVQVENIVI